MSDQQIKRNAAECTGCKRVIESTHRHDFRLHTCPDAPGISFFVDGGKEYLRRGWGGPGMSGNHRDHYIERSEYAPEEGACCANEKRNMNGGCDSCGAPCL